MAKTEKKLIANNKKAYHDYFILEKYEAGIVLHGTEVKSLRMGKCSIKEAFIRVENGEMFIYGMHISPYEKGNIFNKDPLRVKKLLLHRKEIDKIFGKMKEQGITVVPLQVYFSGSLVKVEIGLAKGKKLYDKRADIAKKDQRREAQRDFKILSEQIVPFQSWRLKSDRLLDSIDIAGEDDAVHSDSFRRLDVSLEIVDEEAFLRLQVIRLEQMLIDFRLRFCHLERCGEDNAVEQPERIDPLRPFCEIGGRIREQVDRNILILQLPDKISCLPDRQDMLRPAAEECAHSVLQMGGNTADYVFYIFIIIDSALVQIVPAAEDHIE